MKRHLLLSLLLCLVGNLQASVYFKQLGKADGLSQISVVSICQDELGRMWFGTLEGLSCYDGNRMEVYKPSQSNTGDFFGNEIHNLVADGQGNLFFTSDGVLIRYNLHREHFSSLRQRVSSLFAQGHEVWGSSKDSVFRWNPQEEEFRFVYRLQHPKAITCLYVDAHAGLWMGTASGLYRVDGLENPKPVCIIPKVHIHSLYQDTKGNMWVAGYRKGMYKIEKGANRSFIVKDNFDLPNNDVRCFVEDYEGNLWAGTFNGLNKIDATGQVSCYKKDTQPGSLTHPSVFSLYKDMQGTIWVGTYYGGVHYFNPEMDIFRHYSEDADRNDCLNFSFVGNMVEDKRGDVWICTEGGGLNYLNRKTGKFIHYLNEKPFGAKPYYNLKSIAYDPAYDCLYVGTHKQGFFRFDISTKSIKQYDESKDVGHSSAGIMLHGDSLYFLSDNNIFVKSRQSDAIQRLLPSIPELDEISSSFLIDSKHYLWVSQRNRVLRINLKKPQERYVYPYGEKGLGRFQVLKMIEDRNGTVFLGTSGAGLYEFDTQQNHFKQCSIGNISYCYNMIVTLQGHLAISNEQGLLIYHPRSKDQKIISDKNQLHLSAINDGCGLLQCSDGEMFVGGTEGMTSFMTDALYKKSPTYHLYFSALTVNDKPVAFDSDDSCVDLAFPFASRVVLAHNENNISISFTSNSYIDHTRKSIYEYKLEGFSKEWSTTYGNTLIYTNLDPGKYKLLVREKQLNAQDHVHTIELPITVRSPWWATWIAYLIYGSVVSIIVYVLLRNWRTKMLLRASLAQEKLEKEKNEELTQAKLQFFANISHEFRTPLTLIISQLESLLQSEKLSPFLRTRLQKVYRNTFQFRDLISELLDFRKMERGKLALRVSQVDMIPYLNTIYEDFKGQAQLQNIQFEFHAPASGLLCWCDARQLRKVFSNLLSNAFKYTPEKNKVELLIEETETTVEVKVVDNGVGISPEDLPFIFQRFYQADATASSTSSGIGLALAKGLVDLHHGEIRVKSALRFGSIFTVVLPKANLFEGDAYVTFVEPDAQETGFMQPLLQETVEATDSEPELTPQAEADQEPTDRECVLLVEDNEELLQILTSLLSPRYRVVIAMNGKEGLDKALEERPDLILSDIMMPLLTGIEMCTKIKNHFDLCHIPVVLLTALTSDSKKMEGLQCGADDYIEKPFNNKMLLGRIANILRNRKLLKKKFGEGMTTGPSTDTDAQILALTPIDAKFLARLESVVKEHISDTEFDVNTLASQLALSRSSLYNKLKALSSMTPNEYILNIRLKHSAHLLMNNPELQITEIAYLAGFNSLRYFRHCFKACFNQTPQEYRGN